MYEFYKKNTSYTSCLYTFDEWCDGGCVVILTPDDLNGILPSPNIRGNLSIQGTVHARNVLGYKVHVGDTEPLENTIGNQGQLGGSRDGWIQDIKVEKYVCQVVGIYSNSYIALDAKSGLVGEWVGSEQMGASLRLS